MLNSYDIMIHNEYSLMNTDSEFSYDQCTDTADFFLGLNSKRAENERKAKTRKLITDALVGGSLLVGTGVGLTSAVLGNSALGSDSIRGADLYVDMTGRIVNTLIDLASKNAS